MLTRMNIETSRRRLLAWKARFRGDETYLKEGIFQVGGGEASGGISNDPLHLADLGSHENEAELRVALLQNEEDLLEEVNAALRRIDQGTFGECEACHREIGEERLEALPSARYCIRCARRLERRGNR